MAGEPPASRVSAPKPKSPGRIAELGLMLLGSVLFPIAIVTAPAILLALMLSAPLLTYLKRRKEQQETERKKCEHTLWLLTPQGRAWQKLECEKLSMEKEQKERRRKEAEESDARSRWRQYHESKSLNEISKMSGLEFEEFLARLFSRMGYTDVALTATNDQGGDLLCLCPSGRGVVIQAKRWKDVVGNGAVQELLGAMLYYHRDEGMVVTNSTFTGAARDLAKKDPRITLRDGRWLEEQIKRFLPPVIPEFTWQEYNKAVKDYKPSRPGRARKARSRHYSKRRW